MSNANFSGVQNDLVANNVQVSTVNAQQLNANAGLNFAGLPRQVLMCYSPSTFATTASTGVVNLNAKAGLGAFTTFATGAVKLPQKAIVLGARVDDDGTAVVGGTTFNIGYSATSATAGTQIFSAVTLANVNAGALFLPGNTAAGTAGLAADNFVTVQVNTTDNTAGNLRLRIEYVVL